MLKAMKIQTLIQQLTEIAKIRPDAIVYVEDGMDPSDICPVTNIECNKGCYTGLAEVYIGADYTVEQPLCITDFK